MTDTPRQNTAAEKARQYFRKEAQEKAESAAWAEYHANQAAIHAKTERLKALRLTRDAALPQDAKPRRKAASKAASRTTSK
ncbi:hypothetical protein [Blastochloris sulfoviridis]|uniref:DUF4169 family protein n=1 Tax=Blastochloris sulfoviridis TaxID=50712 RepID=A0A5M6I2P2_9HYPH|nr:hypothetical protein [Blastochloris sulfoviridis]KAA5602474.1 hypothetical protein F1193_04705 [Blastochloris sulfoviridis]